jgi:hypothetical protein
MSTRNSSSARSSQAGDPVHQERPFTAVGVGHLAREDGDALAVRAVVVERDVELVLGEDEAGRADGL